MKYMGSKRSMLQNGLGTLIVEQAQHFARIVDPFCGAGSVAWFAAEKTDRKVLAFDLQEYAVVLAEAVIGRIAPIDPTGLVAAWLGEARRCAEDSSLLQRAIILDDSIGEVEGLVRQARALCQEPGMIGPIWNAYGGHYFSPSQALELDCLLASLPGPSPDRTACLAATICAASACAASPGHTAQPFQPTATAGRFLLEAWKRDPFAAAENALRDICSRHAHVIGHASVGNALEVIPTLTSDDLVIVDPPYSSVQYSRFYHVLETVARGHCSPVEGTGRYPIPEERPKSEFTYRSQSAAALETLLAGLAAVGATVIFTFPRETCTNGLSGRLVLRTGRTWYDIEENNVLGKFSTLGGNNRHRDARKSSDELILLMRPRA
jgi:adenine-specific DNA-methyltransferase